MLDWSKTALVFPGQGSQEVGMGADLVQAFPEAKSTFEEAEELLGASFCEVCFNSPGDALNDTYNTQPALFVMGIALYRVLKAHYGEDLQPAFAAGHSLGEFTALAAGGAMSFAEGLLLVRERGRLMRKAGESNPGAMAAILGLNTEIVTELCAEASLSTGMQVVLANDNCDGQLVISGDKEALNAALPLAERAGARKVVPLAVSVASHSPLMTSITPDFGHALAQTEIIPPIIPVVGNVSAAPLRTAQEIRDELSAQLTSTVRWTESVQYMVDAGVESFVELGPKDVLTGLIKRINRKAERIAINNVESINRLLRH